MSIKKIIRNTTLAITFLGTQAVAPVAFADTKVGTLVCDIEGGVSLIVTSKKELTCTYTAVDNHEEEYTGSIRKFGIDIGETEGAKMVWVVFAPGSFDQGALKGKYYGAVADASLGLGAGVQVLVGGFNKTISLQPLSVQGQTGVNLAIGVGAMTLK